MLNKIEADQAIDLIKNNNKILLLLEKPGDPLSIRAHQVFLINSLKLEQLEYQLYCIDVDENSSKYEELSCVYVPQIRLFNNNEMKHKQIGIPTEDYIKQLLKEELC